MWLIVPYVVLLRVLSKYLWRPIYYSGTDFVDHFRGTIQQIPSALPRDQATPQLLSLSFDLGFHLQKQFAVSHHFYPKTWYVHVIWTFSNMLKPRKGWLWTLLRQRQHKYIVVAHETANCRQECFVWIKRMWAPSGNLNSNQLHGLLVPTQV